MRKRVILGIILLILVYVAPWWLVLPMALIGMMFFSHYYEAMIALLMFDLIHLPMISGALDLRFALIGVVAYGLVEMLIKPRIRFT